MALYTTYNNGELLSFLQKGDEKAFTELYLRYWDKLFYLAGKKLVDLSEAESIVQDVFLDIWKRRETLEIKGTFDGYLVVAVKYRIINAQAKRYREAVYGKRITQNASEADYSTEHWLAFEELRELLDEKVAALPEKCRMAFSLREEGYTQREIASKMQISEKTVEMHISRALKSLSTGLGLLLLSLLL